MREPLGVFAEAIPVEDLDCVHDPRVQLASTVLQQSAVRYLMRERVRERVFEVRKQPGLVEELGRLQPVESGTEHLVRKRGDRLEERKRDILADDRGDLEEAFVLR